MNIQKKAEVIQVIRTKLLRRGDGKKDPIRVMEQFWSFDGKLLAENDPCGRYQIDVRIAAACGYLAEPIRSLPDKPGQWKEEHAIFAQVSIQNALNTLESLKKKLNEEQI